MFTFEILHLILKRTKAVCQIEGVFWRSFVPPMLRPYMFKQKSLALHDDDHKNINPKTKQSKNASSSENIMFSNLLSPFHKTFSSLLKPHLPHIQKTKTRKQTNKQNQGSHKAVPTSASDALCGITGCWWKVRSESVKDSKCWSTLIFAWAHWQFDTQFGKGISFV